MPDPDRRLIAMDTAAEIARVVLWCALGLAVASLFGVARDELRQVAIALTPVLALGLGIVALEGAVVLAQPETRAAVARWAVRHGTAWSIRLLAVAGAVALAVIALRAFDHPSTWEYPRPPAAERMTDR